MEKLVHGGDIYSARERISGEIIDFSANINPLGLPQTVKQALQESMNTFSCYPDPLCRDLVQEIAKHEHIPTESILCGNGAADLIFRISWAIKPRRALIAVPTFAEYEQALSAVGCQIDYFDLPAEHDFCLQEDFLDRIHPKTDLVFLCNPNNPTGQLIDPKLLERILVRCTSCGALLVVDECFRDFLDDPMGNSMNAWVESFPNLLILRAFTKHFAMAGLRLGYCLCSHPILMERMRQCGQPWSVSIPAQVAGIAALQDREYLEKSRKLVSQERSYLKDSLAELGISVIGSHANYLFFRIPDSADLPAQLEQDGILIRSCDNYRGLEPGYYRIAVKNHEQNQKLIDSLTRFLRPSIEPVTAETMTVTLPEGEGAQQADEAGQQTTSSADAVPHQETDAPFTEAAEDSSEPDSEEEEGQMKIPSHDVDALPSAEQKRQYRSLRSKSKKYDWEEEDE